MVNIEPVVLEGYTGGAGDADRFLALSRSPESTSDERARVFRLIEGLRTYNALRPRLAEELAARQERDQALNLVEVRWEALASAANWPAAHHTYVLAVEDARTAIGTWREKAAPAANLPAHDVPRGDGYEQILAAGHPPVEPLDIEVSAAAEQILAELEESADRRRRVAAETLALIGQTAQA